jgi:hypothetical protein
MGIICQQLNLAGHITNNQDVSIFLICPPTLF